MKKRISKKYCVGDYVYVTSGDGEFRNKPYQIKEICGDSLVLDGYKTQKRAQKISQNNTENYKIVDVPVHISNVVGYDKSAEKPSKIGFKDGKKVFKKTGNDVPKIKDSNTKKPQKSAKKPEETNS